MQECWVSTVDGRVGISSPRIIIIIGMFLFVRSSEVCLECRIPKGKPRLSGPSIRRTIAGAVSAVK